MAFWSAEKLAERLGSGLILPFVPERISHSSYELGVGTEAYITSNELGKTAIPIDEKLVIPAGQFGLILTNEIVKIPNDALGFISIRATIKFQGLVNVSGFHVDPGFEGRLKFAVYNAGSNPIVLDRYERVFLIWFADLDRETKRGRLPKNEGWDRITARDVTVIQGDIASPAELKKKIESLEIALGTRITAIETSQTLIKGFLLSLLLIVIGIALKAYYDVLSKPPAAATAPALPTSAQAGSPTALPIAPATP